MLSKLPKYERKCTVWARKTLGLLKSQIVLVWRQCTVYEQCIIYRDGERSGTCKMTRNVENMKLFLERYFYLYFPNPNSKSNFNITLSTARTPLSFRCSDQNSVCIYRCFHAFYMSLQPSILNLVILKYPLNNKYYETCSKRG